MFYFPLKTMPGAWLKRTLGNWRKPRPESVSTYLVLMGLVFEVECLISLISRRVGVGSGEGFRSRFFPIRLLLG